MTRLTLWPVLALGVAAVACDGDGASGSAIDEVKAGAGLTGGGADGTVTLGVDFSMVARAMHTHPWTDLTGIPTAATTGAKCAAGLRVTGIDVSTGKVTCEADADTLGALSCTEGQVAKRTSGGWACGDDETGGGGGGGVTSVGTGPGLMGGPITEAGTISVDFSAVAPADHVHEGDQPWTVVGEGALRFDGAIGLGRDPLEAITVDSVNAQIGLRDRAGANAAAIFLDDADGEGGIMNLSWQRVGVTVATIFLSSAPANNLTYQTEGGTHRWKINAATEAMRIDGITGNVGIGTGAPTTRLEVSDGIGPNATCDGNSWTNASSRKTKEGIRSFGDDDYRRVRRWLDETEVVWYRYIGDKDPRTRVGLIAEDVPAVLATHDRTGISTADAIGFLTAATKELASENDRLRKENAALEARLTRIERRLGAPRQ